ncbi:hypothetical protein HK405_004327 [Cladochytrium tenue]|nr:hypothetical protein HK405_004327 [Cladochytrium tenue]
MAAVEADQVFRDGVGGAAPVQSVLSIPAGSRKAYVLRVIDYVVATEIVLICVYELLELEFSVRYASFYLAICGFLISLGFSLYLIAQQFFLSAFFILPIVTMVISLAAIWTYKDRRWYRLYPALLEYSFAYNSKEEIRGDYYNIYVRLRREVRSGSANLYYLVLNGYQMDSQRLCGSTANHEKLRRLGQQIAANLNIKYFIY